MKRRDPLSNGMRFYLQARAQPSPDAPSPTQGAGLILSRRTLLPSAVVIERTSQCTANIVFPAPVDLLHSNEGRTGCRRPTAPRSAAIHLK
jgi:hypothetical protein